METQLREALSAEAASVSSTELHPYERVAGAVTRSRRRRRAAGAAAVVAAAAIAVAVPMFSSQIGDRTTTPAEYSRTLPGVNDPAWRSISTWPTRGGLAHDAALVERLDEKFSGRTIFVEDMGDERLALIANDTGTLVFATGPRGAAPSHLSGMTETPVTDHSDEVLGVAGGGNLVVLTSPDRTTAEVSIAPEVAPDGTISRSFRPLSLEHGMGRSEWAISTRFKVDGYSGAAQFIMDTSTESELPCGGKPCGSDVTEANERDATATTARLLGLDPARVSTETVFMGPVPHSFATSEELSSGEKPVLHVMHSTLPNGAIVRTAWLRSDTEAQAVEMGQPIDASRADTVPIIVASLGNSPNSTSVSVFVASGTAVRAVGDAPWPSSEAARLTNHVATFEVGVSPEAFQENFRLEVLEGDRVIGVVRATPPNTGLYDETG
ncbi:hypothetical protein N802_13470 [Knoellia sinensis KCTC 19936]|uniref:Uncharacterized protein n=1 Tax=Knoellia sinensis KCTC 19936 TaxID=1385520 RepID=A0A0A0JE55_9MICO|nr:hypothetical protein N802_13470 [Knoellia sinensis KCTC 19936]